MQNRKLAAACVIGCVLSVVLAACGGGGGGGNAPVKGAEPVAHSAAAPPLHGIRVLSRTYSLSPPGPLPRPQTVTLPLSRSAPAGDALVVATAERASGPWTYLPAKLAPNRQSVTFTVTHHSLFTVLGFSTRALVREFERLVLDGLDSGTTTVVGRPSCARQSQARQGYRVASTYGPTVYWCFGVNSEGRILKIVNNRHYPLLIAHPGLAMVQQTRIGFSLSSLSHVLSGHLSVLAPGAEIGYRVALGAGKTTHVSTQFDGFGQSLYALWVGLHTMTEILTRFGAGSPSKFIEALDKALTSQECVNALRALNPGSILSGCFSPVKLADYFGTVGVLLAPIVVDGGIIAFFQNEWQSFHDVLAHRDAYEIAISRPAAGAPEAKPAGGSPSAGGTSPGTQSTSGNGSGGSSGSGGPGVTGGGATGSPTPAGNATISIGWSSAHPGWITMTMQHFPTGTYTYSCDFGSGGDESFTVTETSEPQTFDNGHTCYDKISGDTVWVTIGSVRSNTITVATPTAAPRTYAETVGGLTHTWTNYTNAGGTQGNSIAAYTTVQVSCKVQGFAVADGDTWWYRIASSPWNNAFYASADAFYNDGRTSGSLAGTPFYDPQVPNC